MTDPFVSDPAVLLYRQEKAAYLARHAAERADLMERVRERLASDEGGWQPMAVSEKGAQLARDRVASMPQRVPLKRKKLSRPKGLNPDRTEYNANYYRRNKRKLVGAARKAQRKAWKEQKRKQRATPEDAARPRYSGGDPKPTQCFRGHEYTPENTRTILNKSTGREQRICLVCRRTWDRKHKSRRKERAA